MRFGARGESREELGVPLPALPPGRRGVRARPAHTPGPSQASRTTNATPGPAPAPGCSRRVQRVDPPHFAHRAFAHPLRRVQREAAAEHRHPEKKVTLRVAQQLSAPLDRGAKRALTLGTVSRAPDEERQRPVQPLEEVAAGVRTRSRAAASSSASGTLSSAVTIGGDIGRIVIGEFKLRFHRASSLDEQFEWQPETQAGPMERSARRRCEAELGSWQESKRNWP